MHISAGPYKGALDVLKENVLKEDLEKFIEVVEGDVRDIRSVDDERVDVIISNELFCDLDREGLEKALNEFYRILKPNGEMAHGNACMHASYLDLSQTKITLLCFIELHLILGTMVIEILTAPNLRISYLKMVEKLKELYYNQVSLGKISSKQFFRILDIPDIENEYLDECPKIDPDFLKVSKELCKKYVLAMFSNDVSEWSLYLREKYDLDNFFSKYVISGDVGLRKEK